MRSATPWGRISALALVVTVIVLFALVLLLRGNRSTAPTPLATATLAPQNSPTLAAPTATALPSATATPSAARCAQFTGSSNTFLSQVPLPLHTGIGEQTFGSVDGVAQSYSFDRFAMCSPNMTAAQIHVFFAAQMPQAGWQQTTTFPDGTGGKCADASCWTRSTGPNTARYVSLLAVTDGQNEATYTLDSLNVTINQ